MKYNLFVFFDAGDTVVWNKTRDNEFRVSFESLAEAQEFIAMLVQK
jgi:hypothetical protein